MCPLKRRSPSALAAIALVAALSFTASAANVTVSTTIQAAIDIAKAGDVVIVPAGVYRENINFKGKLITVRSTDPTNAAAVAATIIDGGYNGRPVVAFVTGEGPAAALKGLTIRNGGTAYNAGTPVVVPGGGIYCYRSSPTISGNIVTGNCAFNGSGNGGGIYCDGGSALIAGNNIHDNSASCNGAGVYCANSAATISNNRIRGNRSVRGNGAGVYCGAGAVQGNNISGNYSESGCGGGVYAGSGEIRNNVICDNSSRAPAGIAVVGVSPNIVNNTIANNVALANTVAAGIAVWGGSPTIRNCIFSNLVSPTGSQVDYWFSNDAATSPINVSYSLLGAGWVDSGTRVNWGRGIISGDPAFAGPQDYHERSIAGRWNQSANGGYGGWVNDSVSSPCIDAGDPASPYSSEPQPNGARVNMGAYGNTAQASKAAPPPTIAISVTPDLAPWSLTRPDGSVLTGRGDTMLVVAAGQYSVTWGAVNDSYALPSAVTLTGTAALGKVLTFEGVYHVVKPVFYIGPGVYHEPADVVIYSLTPGSVVYYTTDGSTPTPSSPTYGGGVHMTGITTLKAMAVAAGLGDSDVTSGVYKIDNQPPHVSDVTATPIQVRKGKDLSVAVTATASDVGSGDTNIVAAWRFVGVDPGDGQRPTMQAADGHFGSPTEALKATVSTSSWVAGNPYVISVIARDEAGFDSAPVGVRVLCVDDALPMVTAYAADACATEPAYQQPGRDTGRILISRTGSTASSLTVTYTVSGTATSGMDYDLLPLSVVIPAGASSASVEIVPIGDTLHENCETVTLTVISGHGYCAAVPDSATVTIADSGASGALYSFSASDAESSTTSTSWQGKTSLQFRPTVADNWVIFAFAEYKSSQSASRASVRLTQDGATPSEVTSKPAAPGDYMSFVTAKFAPLTAATHRFTIDYHAADGATAYIRNARIVAVREAELEIRSAPNIDSTTLGTTIRDIDSLAWTPSVAGDYLLVWSAEWSGQPGYPTRLQTKLNGAVLDDVGAHVAGAGDFFTFTTFDKVTCTAAPQTMSIAAGRSANSPGPHYLRHCRLIAIRLSGARLSCAIGADAPSERTSTSTTFADALTAPLTLNRSANWLLLTSFSLTGSSTHYSTEVRSSVDGAVSGQPLRRPVRAGCYLPAGSVDARFLGTTAFEEVAFRTSNAAATARVKCVRFAGLPLD